jgi:polyisoprenoid-binding protein YceI
MNAKNSVKETDNSGKSRRGRYLIAGAGLLVVALVGGPWVYINLIKDDAPEKLTVDALGTLAPTSDPADSTSAAPGAETTVATDASVAGGAADSTALDSAASTETTIAGGTDGASATASSDLTGSWAVTQPSTAGYRVKEILFGQSTEGVGRTTDVTGSIAISGSSLTEGKFTVDLTTLKSDADRRDSQVQNRLLETATNPTATFTVKGPVVLPATPAVGDTVTVDVPGSLNLHGADKDLTISLTVKRTADGFQVAGSTDILFADYGIDWMSPGYLLTPGAGGISSFEYQVT